MVVLQDAALSSAAKNLPGGRRFVRRRDQKLILFAFIHTAVGLKAHGDRNTRREATWRKTKTKHSRTPVSVTMCREKKSQCQSVSALSAQRQQSHREDGELK